MIVKTIGFDYRMQRDPSNAVRVSPRLDEVVNYILASRNWLVTSYFVKQTRKYSS